MKWIVSMLLIAMPCVSWSAEQAGKKEMDVKFDQLFNTVDTSGDGKISREEAALKAPAMADGFDAIDTNHDGGLSKVEIKAFTAALEKSRREFQKRLTKADKDKNGLLSREEATDLPNLSAHFDEIDTNLDGQLNIKEISDYLRSLTAAAHPATASGTAPTAPAK